jgi:hypothetical protein
MVSRQWLDGEIVVYMNHLTRRIASLRSHRARFERMLDLLGPNVPRIVHARHGVPIWNCQGESATMVIVGEDEEAYQQGVVMLAYHLLWLFKMVPSSFFAPINDDWYYAPRYLLLRIVYHRFLA